jgi:hypothetical protein
MSDRTNHRENELSKFECRYDKIECKCIFRPAKFSTISEHYPKNGVNYVLINSVNLEKCKLDAFYSNLREKDIKKAYLVCHHYRLVSVENCIDKLKFNKYYNGHTNTFALEELLASVYLEIKDDTLRIKTLHRDDKD